MKHALVVIKPPYGTQIINQSDGTLMFKFERLRKKGMTDMLFQALSDVEAVADTEPVEEFKVVDLNPPAVQTVQPMIRSQVKVATIHDRDSLPADFRRPGRRVLVEANKVEYELVGGVSNQHWKEAEPNG